MPAPQRYPTPYQQLLEIAIDAKKRGVPFDEWWDRAIPPAESRPTKRPRKDKLGRPLPSIQVRHANGTVVMKKQMEEVMALGPSRPLREVGEARRPGEIAWPRDTEDRRNAYLAAVEAREGWRRAYEGEPPLRCEIGLMRLAPIFEEMERRGSPVGPDVDLAAA